MYKNIIKNQTEFCVFRIDSSIGHTCISTERSSVLKQTERQLQYIFLKDNADKLTRLRKLICVFVVRINAKSLSRHDVANISNSQRL